MIRCARSNCYRGGNGQKHESDDTEGDFGEVAAALSQGWSEAQRQVVGSSAGAVGVSSQVGGPRIGRTRGAASGLGKCRAAGELRAERVGAMAAADLAGERLRVRASVGGDVAGMDPSL